MLLQLLITEPAGFFLSLHINNIISAFRSVPKRWIPCNASGKRLEMGGGAGHADRSWSARRPMEKYIAVRKLRSRPGASTHLATKSPDTFVGTAQAPSPDPTPPQIAVRIPTINVDSESHKTL